VLVWLKHDIGVCEIPQWPPPKNNQYILKDEGQEDKTGPSEVDTSEGGQ
jgi:hypothetical protein